MEMLAKFKQTKFYKGCVKLLNDLKPMTFKQRVEHLWMYYKDYLWVVALVVIFICAGITSFINQGKEVLVSGMMVNITIEQEGYDYLSVDYFEELGAKEGKQVVELEYTNFSSLEDPTSSEDNYYASMVVIGKVSGRFLDYMILDKFGMEFYITQDVYLDLREFFTEDELAELEQKRMLIYAQEEGQERYPIAVDISSLPFTVDNVTSEGNSYFALSGSTQRPEACRAIWERINAWETEE